MVKNFIKIIIQPLKDGEYSQSLKNRVKKGKKMKKEEKDRGKNRIFLQKFEDNSYKIK